MVCRGGGIIRFVSLKLRSLLDQSKLTNHRTYGVVCVTAVARTCGYVLEEVHTTYREQTTL